MYSKFDKDNLKLIRNIIKTALEPVGKHLGMEFDLGNISYTDNTFNVTLTAAIGGMDRKLEEDFKRSCRRYGLSESDFGATFVTQGNTYKLTGFKSRAQKYPCITLCIDGPKKGESIRFTKETVLLYLGKSV